MGDKSNIEWTDATWNPIVGCSIVSPGCTNCYAMQMAARIETMRPSHYDGTTKKVNGNAVWTGNVALAPDHILTAPLRWKKPRRIFVNSMGDLFHESIPDEWIDRVFAVMALCPQHTFQVLTKRAERMRNYFIGKERYRDIHPLEDRMGAIDEAMAVLAPPHWCNRELQDYSEEGLPLPNVWLGVSCERQQEADERIPLLLQTPAAIRFISAEPLLGSIDLVHLVAPEKVEGEDWRFSALEAGDMYHQRTENEFDGRVIYDSGDGPYREHALDWVIVGGESGPHARPMQPQWARDIRDQCQAPGVKFFFKQWSAWLPASQAQGQGLALRTRETLEDEPVHLVHLQKKLAGRLLDGREWNEFPQVRG